jgi:GH15 family glucan-1,4-alpha-glucosidase
MSLPIEDYAVIGDCRTIALVGRDGSIDWLCWPRFDSGACFAALLGGPENGRFIIRPVAPVTHSSRRYRGDTLILETDFETAEGAVTLIDFMPYSTDVSDLIRIVVGRRGRVEMQMELVLRFDYGASVPWVSRLPDGAVRAVAGPEMTVLRTPVELRGERMKTLAMFSVEAGQEIPFVLTHGPSHLPPPSAIDVAASLRQTDDMWRQWAERCPDVGQWTSQVKRSLVTLKALTYAPTGGIVAAATTSLPEQLGGERNWDYRYCWLRDATLTLLALMNANYLEEATAWRAWLQRAIAGSPAQLQIMYGLGGERRLEEWTVDWLAGYENSRPVRIGNAAAGQLQLDVYGEVMDALHQARKAGLPEDPEAWSMQRAMMDHLSRVWQQPDEGMWEIRGGRRHFTYSKVMAWVAVDRAIQDLESLGLHGPARRWHRLRDQIHADVCANGYSSAGGSFVQSYGSNELDASLLLISATGFLPPGDPRIVGTIAAIEKDLTQDGLVMRYRTESGADGLPPGEGVFLACSFWMVDALVQQKRRPQAVEMFEQLLLLANDVGLYAEEYDVNKKRLVGNFPQAFSHVAMVNSAFALQPATDTMLRSDRRAGTTSTSVEPMLDDRHQSALTSPR